MTKAYCKWPVIVAIIIGALIVLSLLTCLFRCLCCGVECCCGCLSCCNSCCPSPRRRGGKEGYQQPAFQQQAFPPPQQQYHNPQMQPMYAQQAGNGYRGQPGPAQTATFDAAPKMGRYNEDALPAMPSWDNATSKHVEDHDDMEMGNLDRLPQSQQQGQHGNNPSGYDRQETSSNFGYVAPSSAPLHDYAQHHQYAPTSPTSTAYPPTYHTSPTSTMYEPTQLQHQQWGGGGAYAAGVPPSYRTSPASPPPQQIGRKPVQGSWREV